MNAARLRALVDGALDSGGELLDRSPRLAAWRDERVLAQVARRASVLSVLGANDVRYFIRPGDSAIGEAIIQWGAFEPERVDAALSGLAENGVVIDRLLDVGANIGTTTIEVLRRMPSVRAIAFEPDPQNFQLLRLNLIANGLRERVDVRRVALGDVDGTATLELSPDNFGDHRIRLRADGIPEALGESAWPTIEVSRRRLNDLDLEIDPHTLVHVAVQGHEGLVLAGGRRALRICPPLVVRLWPYGLERAGGRQLLFDELARWDRIYDIKAGTPRQIAHGDLPAHAASLGEIGHTDLLALAD